MVDKHVNKYSEAGEAGEALDKTLPDNDAFLIWIVSFV